MNKNQEHIKDHKHTWTNSHFGGEVCLECGTRKNQPQEPIKDWEKIFDEFWETELSALKTPSKQFISTLLQEERQRTVLKGERQRIIEQIRSEERKKVKEEVIKEVNKMKLEIDEPGNTTMERGYNICKANILYHLNKF